MKEISIEKIKKALTIVGRGDVATCKEQDEESHEAWDIVASAIKELKELRMVKKLSDKEIMNLEGGIEELKAERDENAELAEKWDDARSLIKEAKENLEKYKLTNDMYYKHEYERRVEQILDLE